MLNFWPILRVHMLIGFMLIKKKRVMLKSNFNFLGAIMKCQKCCESQALHKRGGSSLWKGSNDTFEDVLAQYYTVCPNKCILNSFKFLSNNLDTRFTWTPRTYCISMIIF